MNNLLRAGSASLMTLALASAPAPAHAAALCKLTGNYSDNYNSTTSITGKKGTIQNSAVCATAYTFKISNETAKGFTATGKNPTKSCGSFTARLTFQNSCSVFSGSVTIDGSKLSDTFTKINGATYSKPSNSADLSAGLH